VAETPVWLDAAPTLQGTSVLLVEDDPDGREVVASVLTRCGADVTTAPSAEVALAQLQKRRVDVIVCDIHMPGMDGHAFMRRVRQLRPKEGGRTPAAALTAAVTAADRMEALAAGFQIHLAKPVQPAELAMVVASLAAGGRKLETR
jgi:CheY-like chemotaxis protein